MPVATRINEVPDVTLPMLYTRSHAPPCAIERFAPGSRSESVQPTRARMLAQAARWILMALVVPGISASVTTGCGASDSEKSSPSAPAGGASITDGNAAGTTLTVAGSGAAAGTLAGASGASGAAKGVAGKAGASGRGLTGAGGKAGSAGAGGFEATNAQPWCKANAFALSDVTLDKSDFTANRDRTLAYLRSVDVESLLYNFRVTVGLPTNNATPPVGWEAPSQNLRGHATGHVLKALAQAYAGTSDPQYKSKADKLLTELKKCQDLAESKGFGAGYLSAYPPDQFIKLESLAEYPAIWAPYYTLHKILSGLLASYQLTGNKTALDMAKKVGVWVNGRLSKLPRAQLQSMWNLYIAGETGGMNEVLAELSAVTGDKLFLETAVLFDKDLVLDSCSANQDKLNGLHANQHIPTITGYMRVYDANASEKYLNAARHFWSMVTTSHMYVIGGTGEAEMFKPAGQIAAALTEKTCETCATYNMLKLTRELFCNDPDAKYMDYYERGLYNHILGSQDPTSSKGAVTYFVPLQAGASRSYDASFTCCHGTGMENHTKYQEQIYSYSTDGSILYVNLYIPSKLNWVDRGFKVAQATNYPYEPSSTLTFEGAGPLKVALRIPSWAVKGVNITVNGEAQNVSIKAGTYALVDRTWTSGDKLELTLPFNFRIERTPDDNSLGAILYGPSVIVAQSSSRTTMTLNVDVNNPAASFTPTGEPLTFTSNSLTFEPFYKASHIAYHTYFKF